MSSAVPTIVSAGVVAAIYFVVDGLILAALRPLLKRITHLTLFRFLAEWIESLNSGKNSISEGVLDGLSIQFDLTQSFWLRCADGLAG
jgi:hypothetical protein